MQEIYWHTENEQRGTSLNFLWGEIRPSYSFIIDKTACSAFYQAPDYKSFTVSLYLS